MEITLKLIFHFTHISTVIHVAHASYLLQKVNGVLQYSSEQLRVPSGGVARIMSGPVFRSHAAKQDVELINAKCHKQSS